MLYDFDKFLEMSRYCFDNDVFLKHNWSNKSKIRRMVDSLEM